MALHRRILNEKKITIEQWLRDNDIGRSSLYAWRGAGGRAVYKKVSQEMADKIKTAILRDAAALGLIPVKKPRNRPSES